jgi:hypothetical protein
MITLWIEPAAFRFVTWRLNQLSYRVSRVIFSCLKIAVEIAALRQKIHSEYTLVYALRCCGESDGGG